MANVTEPTGDPAQPLTLPKTMTVRDIFAAHALQGIIAAHSGETALPDEKAAAKWSREYADSLLFELALNPFPG